MADNTQLGAAAGGDTIRDIDRAGIKTQVIQLDAGGAAAESLVTTANPLPVTLQTAGATQPVSGTVTANQGGAPWSENISQFGGSAVVTGTGVSGAGIPRVTVANDSVVGVSGTVTVAGTVTANQGGAPWADNITQVAGVALGATAVTNFGTAPAAAAVEGVNASLYAGTTGLTQTGGALDINLKTSAATVTVGGTVTSNQGGAPWTVKPDGTVWTLTGTSANANITNTVTVSGTVTTTPPANASTNVAQFGGVNVSTGTGASGTGIPRVTVANDSQVIVAGVAASGAATSANPVTVGGVNAGNAVNFSVDASGRLIVIGPSASGAGFAGNPVLIGGTFNTAPPTVTNAQAVYLQASARGSLSVMLADGTSSAAIKAASTAPAAADPSLVVAISPNVAASKAGNIAAQAGDAALVVALSPNTTTPDSAADRAVQSFVGMLAAQTLFQSQNGNGFFPQEMPLFTGAF